MADRERGVSGDESSGRSPLGDTTIGGRTIHWGARTLVMGILNATPDSFSGDGLLADPAADPVTAALGQARRMIAEGADFLDVGGELTRPGHAEVDEPEELRRVVPIVAAIHAALPAALISVDTTKPAIAAAALDAGASLLNDVWGVGADDGMRRLAAERDVPIVVMHNRAVARYDDLIAEILADLAGAIERALALGVRWEHIIVDPGFGFGKTAEHNVALLRELSALRVLGRPILLGTSRKSTLGWLLGGAPPEDRLEATLATTALGIAAGVDIVRVHDVGPNVRVARVTDAIVRGDVCVTDRIVLHNMIFQGRHGVLDREQRESQPFQVDVELVVNLQPAAVDDDIAKTVDYAQVFDVCRQIVESTSFRLLETLAEAIAHELLVDFPVTEVGIRVRKPNVPIDGTLDWAGVEIWRQRSGADRRNG